MREERIKERTKNISHLREAERNAEEKMKESSRRDETEDREREREEWRTRSDILRRQRSQVSHLGCIGVQSTWNGENSSGLLLVDVPQCVHPLFFCRLTNYISLTCQVFCNMLHVVCTTAVVMCPLCICKFLTVS